MDRNYRIEILQTANLKVANEISLLIKQLDDGALEISVQYLNDMVRSASTFIFVAINDKKQIIGTTTLIRNRSLNGHYKIWLEDVVVDKAHRRKGIAQALISAALTKAGELKIKNVYLTSRPSRIEANILYKKLGFAIYETNIYKYEL